MCEACFKGMSFSSVRGDIFKGSGFRPPLRFFGEGKTFFGIENEVELFNNAQKNYCWEVIQSPLWFCKSDCSIEYGVETVSHPFTLDYMQGDPDGHFERKFEAVNRHALDDCDQIQGLHVHVCREAIRPSALSKILTCMLDHMDFFKEFSRRDRDSWDEWGKFRFHRDDISYFVKRVENNAHFSAGGIRSNTGTYEFRFPGAVTDHKTLCLTIEFIHAMVKHASATAREAITPETIERYAANREGVYKYYGQSMAH
jgi:hypothetical protein